MGSTSTDRHGGDGRDTPGLVEDEPARRRGGRRRVATDEVIDPGPHVRGVGLAGLRDWLSNSPRWVERHGVLAAMAVGLFAGAGWGIVARAWMRLIAEHGEFTWSGTLYIVGAPAVIGSAVALAHTAMARGWRAAELVRVPAVVVHVLLGMGAGTLLLPTIVFGSVALARRRVGLATRIVLGLGVLATGLPVGVGDGASGMAVALVAAGVVVAVLVMAGWRTPVVLAALAVLPALGVSASILATDIPLGRALPGSLSYLPLVAIPTLTAASLLRPRDHAPVDASGVPSQGDLGDAAPWTSRTRIVGNGPQDRIHDHT